jgi:hypothetical protein
MDVLNVQKPQVIDRPWPIIERSNIELNLLTLMGSRQLCQQQTVENETQIDRSTQM